MPSAVSRFNGAATLSLRKPAAKYAKQPNHAKLQWGRNIIVAETRQMWGIVNTTKDELQWGRNIIVAETRKSTPNIFGEDSGFNGAATLSLRKPPTKSTTSFAYTSFNGAATLSLRKRGGQGQALRQATSFNGAATLSFGTGFTMRSRHTQYLASMGPQHYRCGNLIKGFTAISNHLASMGPQHYRCGNTSTGEARAPRTPCFNGAATLSLRKRGYKPLSYKTMTELQWGRNIIVAETQLKWCPFALKYKLQWAATLSLRKRSCPCLSYPS